jgi:hypothetical protein
MGQCSGDGTGMTSCFFGDETSRETQYQPVDLFWGPGSFYAQQFPQDRNAAFQPDDDLHPGDPNSIYSPAYSSTYTSFPGGFGLGIGFTFIQPSGPGENLGLPPGINVPAPTIWDALGIQMPCQGDFGLPCGAGAGFGPANNPQTKQQCISAAQAQHNTAMDEISNRTPWVDALIGMSSGALLGGAWGCVKEPWLCEATYGGSALPDTIEGAAVGTGSAMVVWTGLNMRDMNKADAAFFQQVNNVCSKLPR